MESQDGQVPSTTPPAGTSRRTMLKTTGGLAAGLATLDLVGRGSWIPNRVSVASADVGVNATLPDIQHDIGSFIAPVQTVDGVLVQFGPVHTVFLTAKLLRTPTKADQAELARALNLIESAYPFASNGIFPFISYGLPYFRKLPGGLTGSLVSSRMPRLLSNNSRFALEEAVASPTDVSPSNPGISKLRFNVPVAIESNDILITLRSDNAAFLADAIAFLAGSNFLGGQLVRSPAFLGLLTFTSSRSMFQQVGLPRFVAAVAGLPFQNFVNHKSPMWMGFADQQVAGAGPAAITTFKGNASARFTNAVAGSYFDNGSIQHLSHDIIDMLQWFDMPDANSAPDDDGVFTERVQYMFHSPAINPGNADQLTDGGGPAFLPTENRGPNYAARTAAGIGTEDNEHRMGHLSTLQRSSRAADGTPIHIRMDGPGFDSMDVPDGSTQPKLQFTVFVPTADFFATMRRNQASLDLAAQFDVEEAENGLERFLTATRRQNFLLPPRRHRAFPLVELT